MHALSDSPVISTPRDDVSPTDTPPGVSPARTPLWRRWWVWVLALIVLIGLIVGVLAVNHARAAAAYDKARTSETTALSALTPSLNNAETLTASCMKNVADTHTCQALATAVTAAKNCQALPVVSSLQASVLEAATHKVQANTTVIKTAATSLTNAINAVKASTVKKATAGYMAHKHTVATALTNLNKLVASSAGTVADNRVRGEAAAVAAAAKKVLDTAVDTTNLKSLTTATTTLVQQEKAISVVSKKITDSQAVKTAADTAAAAAARSDSGGSTDTDSSSSSSSSSNGGGNGGGGGWSTTGQTTHSNGHVKRSVPDGIVPIPKELHPDVGHSDNYITY